MLDNAIRTLAGEWAVISGAPISFVLSVLAVGAVIALVLREWHKREKDALRAENTLKGLRIDGLKEETDRQAKKIAELQNVPSLSPAARMGFTSTVTQEAVMEVVRTHSLKFYGGPETWTPEQLNQFAPLIRAEELGAARIDRVTRPSSSTVVATVNAAELEKVLNWHKDKEKP